MPRDPDHAAQTGFELEWDRLRGFLRSPTGPLAIIEVESAAHADEVVSAVTGTDGAGPVLVFRLQDDAEPRRVIDWLTENEQDAAAGTLFLVLGLDDFAADETKAREFWTWMNFQRERFRPARGKLAFVLIPRHVNCLARCADALWDWIPLKFNLLRAAPGERAVRESQQMMQLRRPGRDPGAAAKILPALREQLAEARRQGLPEAIVRRDYAWPLLRALSDAGYLAEARRILERELFGDVASELDPAERSDWWATLGSLHLELWGLAPAESAFRELIYWGRSEGRRDKVATGYHGMGRVAQARRDFAAAEQWYRKALAIDETQGNEHGAAIMYHQLGIIAQERRDFAAAEQWYRKALAAFERLGGEQHAASTYHQLGRIAEEQRDFAAAEQWYRKSLAIKEKQNDERGAASTYHQLGSVAQQQRDFAAAEQWYRKSLAIEEKLGNEHGAASTHHQLGMIAQKRRDFAAAEQWYRKSLAIKEKQGNEHGAALTYGQVGNLALDQRDFAAAEQWYRKSLAIWEKQGNEHGAAGTYHQLGMIAQGQRDFAAAEQWYRKALAVFERLGIEHHAAGTYHQLGMIAEERRDFAAAEQWYRKSLAIDEKLGNEHGAAITYGQLGILAGWQHKFEESGRWLIRSALTFTRCNDPYNAEQAAFNFLVLLKRAPADVQAKLKPMWREAGLGELPEGPGK